MSVQETIPVITIDGPAGSGKGTIAQRIARELSWHILDSGALYRLVALAVQRNNIDINNDLKVTRLAETLNVEFKPGTSGGVDIYLDGDLVTQNIRSEACGCDASVVAAKKGVRDALFDRQRRFRKLPGLIADGRDMGTVVFPDAGLKIFLTASPEIRAERRLNQLKQQGISANLRGLIRDIEERDARDMQRKDAPLVPATDAIIIDTDNKTIDEVCATVMKHVETIY